MASKKQSVNCQATCPRCCRCWNANSGISGDTEANPERPNTARSNYSKQKRSKSTGGSLDGFGGLQNRDKYGNHRQLYSVKEEAEPEDWEQSEVDVAAASSAKMNNFYSYGQPRLIDNLEKKKNFCVGREVSSGEFLDYHRRNKNQTVHWNEMIVQVMEERERKYSSSKLSDEEPLLKQEKPKKLRRVSRFFINLVKIFENIQGHSGASEDGQGEL